MNEKIPRRASEELRMTACAVLFLLASATAASAMQCSYPKSCAEVIYASYEIGESGSVSNHVKFTCRRESGQVSTYIAWVMNAWGFIGLNRVGSDGTQIDFTKGSNEKLECR